MPCTGVAVVSEFEMETILPPPGDCGRSPIEGCTTMSDGMYEFLALLPDSSGFTLDAAVAHFGKIRDGNRALRAELAVSEGDSRPSGFRVFYGHWQVIAWLEDCNEVLTDSNALAEVDDPPAPASVIASCSRRLSIWSDEDKGGDYSDQITHFTDQMRTHFGAFIYDPVNGGWWA